MRDSFFLGDKLHTFISVLWSHHSWFGHPFLSDVGFEVPDKFVVGYALDYNEYFRDLNVSIGGGQRGAEWSGSRIHSHQSFYEQFVPVLWIQQHSLSLFCFSISASLVRRGRRSTRPEEHCIIIFNIWFDVLSLYICFIENNLACSGSPRTHCWSDLSVLANTRAHTVDSTFWET